MKINYDTIIIGAGPAGIQAGYYFKKLNIDYLILEKNDKAGSFFEKYPHSQKLISINKKYTGSDNKEFNLRHDWNSLLNDFNLEFKIYSDNFYPDRQSLVEYLNDFVKKYNLNVKYNCKVVNIIKIQNNKFQLIIHTKNKNYKLYCNKLIVASGLSKPNIPLNIQNADKYTNHYSQFDKDFFLNKDNLKQYINKKVLILGSGNSAFEIANILNEYCSNIIVMGKNHTPKVAFATHYSGHLRSVYLPFYDTFFLKSNNGIDFVLNNKNIIIDKTTDNTFVLKKNCGCCDYGENYNNFYQIINCTGWRCDFDFFDSSIKPICNKFPVLNSKYESINIPNLFFIGSLMHFFDQEVSSGGFIHGFRYLIDAFIKINYKNVVCFKTLKYINKQQLTNQIVKRINTSSALYQMFGELGDIFYKDEENFYYIEQVPISYIFSKYNNIKLPKNEIFILTLEYNKEYETDLRELGLYTGGLGNENKSRLLHPVVRIFDNKDNKMLSLKDDFFIVNNGYDDFNFVDDIYHLDEDLLVNFKNDKKYYQRFIKILNAYYN